MQLPELDRRPGSTRTRGVVASAALPLGLLLSSLLAGCGALGPVAVTSPEVSAADRAACEALLGDLPEVLAGEDVREVSPASALGAAWGDPAITLTCGVSLPEEFDEFSSCEEADGVGWFVPVDQVEDQSADVTLTAAGFRPIVQVVLPGSYRPEGAATVITQLGKPVSRHLELVDECS